VGGKWKAASGKQKVEVLDFLSVGKQRKAGRKLSCCRLGVAGASDVVRWLLDCQPAGK